MRPGVGRRPVKTATWLLTLWVIANGSSSWALPAHVALIHSAPTLGNVAGNLAALRNLVQQAFANGANVVVTPELSATGYSITRQQVRDGSGFQSPYPQLDSIRDTAIANAGYVFVAIAAVAASGGPVYNTVVVYGPDGLITTQEKRGLSGWHDRGVLPFDILRTPYGDIGYLICSDSYLPDWLRIMTKEGADMILLPANWWGAGQVEIWQVRARENGIWFLTANRWGTETDTRSRTPFVYDMNDAPSAVITPDGKVQLIHRAQDDPIPHDTILYYTVNVPQYRIGTALNPVYTVNFRKPSAYADIANTYYRPDLGNVPAPHLPPSGVTNAASFAYAPSLNPRSNFAVVQRLFAQASTRPAVVVLPGFGISAAPVSTATSTWYQTGVWAALQQFVEDHGIQLLATSILERTASDQYRESLLVLRPRLAPLVRGQVHDSLSGVGTGIPPAPIDLPNARVGVLLGRDALFPELSTDLAKTGIDILAITSRVGAVTTDHSVDASNYFWEVDMLYREWTTATNHVFHLLASDWTGYGTVIENLGGAIGREVDSNATSPARVLDLDSKFVRTKYLNAYYSFDLEELLGR